MGSLATLLALASTFALSHIGGEFAASILARFGLLGYGGHAARILRVGRILLKLYRAARGTDREEAARHELLEWIQKHDPQRLTPIARAVEDDIRTAGQPR